MNDFRPLLLAAAMAGLLALPTQAGEMAARTGGTPASSATLVLTVVGIDDIEGNVMVGLYDSEAGFEAEDDVEGRTVPVQGPEAVITFAGIPTGDYALKVFHDQDADGKLDTTLGIPSEPYGFSNNASDPFSAPEWEETRFAVSGGRPTHLIDLD